MFIPSKPKLINILTLIPNMDFIDKKLMFLFHNFVDYIHVGLVVFVHPMQTLILQFYWDANLGFCWSVLVQSICCFFYDFTSLFKCICLMGFWMGCGGKKKKGWPMVKNGVNMRIASICKNKQNLVKMRNVHSFFEGVKC